MLGEVLLCLCNISQLCQDEDPERREVILVPLPFLGSLNFLLFCLLFCVWIHAMSFAYEIIRIWVANKIFSAAALPLCYHQQPCHIIAIRKSTAFWLCETGSQLALGAMIYRQMSCFL